MSRKIALFLACTIGAVVACDETPAPPAGEGAAPTQAASASPVEGAPGKKPKAASPPKGPPPWGDRLKAGSGFPCDVEKVLAETCRRCHWEPRENDAPFSLLTWDDTQKVRAGQPIHVLMRKQIEAGLMPPVEEVIVEPPVTPLSPEQKKVLLDWLGAGAQKTDEGCSEK